MRTIQWGLEFRTQFRFWMVQSCSIGKWFGFRMPFEIRTKWRPFCPNHSKTEHHSKSDFKNVRFSNGFGITMLRNFNLRTQICEKPISFMKSRIVCLRNFFLSFQPVIFYMHSVNAKTYQFCIPVLLFAYIIISTVYSWSNCLSWFYIRNFTFVTIMSEICFENKNGIINSLFFAIVF